MYSLAITRDFIARHYLIGGDWGRENALHSHHYRLEIRLAAAGLDRHGYLVDIVELDRAAQAVIGRLSERVLNDLPEFAGLNPSIERLAHLVWSDLMRVLNLDQQTLSVRVWENESDWAGYSE